MAKDEPAAEEERDAALARAEAAEKECQAAKLAISDEAASRWQTIEALGLGSAEANNLATQVIGYRARALAAESRLTDATALLENGKRYIQSLLDGPGPSSDWHGAQMTMISRWTVEQIMARLCATPAPAAPDDLKFSPAAEAHLNRLEAEPEHGAIIRACGLLARAWESENDPRNTELGVVPDVAREMSVAAAREHDSLLAALRECRAELETVRGTARKLHESLTSSAGDARLWKSRYEDECASRTVLQRDLTASRALVERIESAVESTTVGEWRDMTGYRRLAAIIRASKKEGT